MRSSSAIFSFLLSFGGSCAMAQVPTAPPMAPLPGAGTMPTQPGLYNQPVVVGSSFESVETKRLDQEKERESLAAQKAEFTTDVGLLMKKLAAASITAAAPESMPLDLGVYNSFSSAEAGNIERSEQYFTLLKETLNALVPSSPYVKGNTNWSDPKMAEANLAKLREFAEDEDISRTIQAQISAIRGGEFTGAQRSKQIERELKTLAEQLRRTEWNLKQSSGRSPLTGEPLASEADLAMYTAEIAELKKNQVALEAEKLSLSTGVSSIPRKIQFQELIVELAVQQRYIHSLIACGFYRLYSADMQIDSAAYAAHQKDGKDSDSSSPSTAASPENTNLAPGQGAPPTPHFDPVPTIPSMEAFLLTRIRDAVADRKSIDNKLRATQLAGAESLLRKMLATAKYQPELHTIPFEDRQKIYRFGQRMKALSEALGSYDYAELTKIATEIESMTSDVSLVDVKAFAAKNAAKALHWAQQARLAQKMGQFDTMNSFMTAAMERAPLDAEVKKVIREIQDTVVGDQELAEDLKKIVNSQPPRYREAYDRRDEFSRLEKGANGELKTKFEALLEMEKDVQATLEKCDGFERRSSYPDVWIALSEMDPALAEDPRIVARKTKTVGKCPNFVNAYDQATEREKSGELALALAWYLTAMTDAPSAPELMGKVDLLSKQLATD